MKVFFTASIVQREELRKEYQAIINAVKKLGHELLMAGDVMNVSLEEVMNPDQKEQESYFRLWQNTINFAQIGVVEVSFPSTVHIGTEIAALVERDKPVICLHTKGRDPFFTGEFHYSRFVKLEYDTETVEDVLKWGFEEVERMMNRRFTFFVSPEIDDYLNKISRQKSLPRSEYIRNLILKDMKKSG